MAFWYQDLRLPRAAHRANYDPWTRPTFWIGGDLELRDFPHDWSDVLVLSYETMLIDRSRGKPELSAHSSILATDKNIQEEVLFVLEDPYFGGWGGSGEPAVDLLNDVLKIFDDGVT